ncbi:MAG TPA: malectin [Verrucomicrobiae bacterium]|nr:malectin [Verrucomicrobiae bacterium]
MHISIAPRHVLTSVLLGLIAVAFAGCESNKAASEISKPTPAATASGTSAKPVEAPKPKVVLPTVRINAGRISTPYTDKSGNMWLADQGFVGGDVVERLELAIGNTTDPTIYQTERYSMESFSHPLPNGKYIVKLHFAETFEGITDKGQRVFNFNVEGQEFKDFDVFVKAGGVQKAYIETVPVDITDGKLDITFTHNIENPEINGIEIIPGT